MASERDIKRRIKAVRNTQQITKAMKMVAAARIKKAEDVLKAARPYAQLLKEVVQDLVSNSDEVVHPMMQTRPVTRTGYLIVTSDKGLCGAFNNNLLKLVMNTIGSQPADRYRLLSVGAKGDKFLKRRKVPLARSYTGWVPTAALAQELADQLFEWFTSGEVDEVQIFYSQSISAVNQKPTLEPIMPLSRESVVKVDSTASAVNYEFEPSPEAALNVLLPRYLSNIIYRVLAESRVAELGARLKSMSNATDNAEKLAGELTLQFYRVRQDNITSEILEIVGGAEALRGSK